MDQMSAAYIDLFVGAMSPQLAYVYATVAPADNQHKTFLSGTLRGPLSAHTRTLPATIDFEFLGDQPQPLARSVVPDPCFWSPGQPYYYEAKLVWQTDRQEPIVATRMLAMRRLGPANGRLVWDHVPWQLHAAEVADRDPICVDDWKAAELAVIVRNSATEILQKCSRIGVPVVVDLTRPDDPPWFQRLRQFVRWPAVAVAILPAKPAGPDRPYELAPNVLFLQEWPAQNSPVPDEHVAGLVVDPKKWDPLSASQGLSDTAILLRHDSPMDGTPEQWKQLCRQQEHESEQVGTANLPLSGTLLFGP